jgi:hypothetical protein
MYRKNVSGQYVYFCLVNASTGAALTGATVTAYRALDSGSQATATGTTTELANGQYRYNLSQADTNGNYGSYLFTATNAVPVEKTVVFTAANPTDAAAFGLSKFADIQFELTTIANNLDNVEARLPATLIGGRMDSIVGAVASNAITAASIAASALDNKGNWNVGKTGYALTAGTGLGNQTANITGSLSGSVGSVTGAVTVGTMNANTLTASALATDAVNEIVDQVWDEPYNQHTTAGTFGKLMDTIRKSNLSIDGTVTNAITPTTLTFSSNVSATTSAYAHAVLLFTTGPLAGENSPIISYNSTNGVFVLEEPLTAAPSNGDEFVVIAGSHVHAIADIQAGLALEATSQLIKAKTDLITSGIVQIVSPVGAGGNITTPIFSGDDYKESNGRAFQWTIDARTGFSAGTATCRFGGYSEETGDSWNVSGTVTDIGGGEWRLSFDLTKTVTSQLAPGFYRWSVELANPGGDEVTEVYNSNANRQVEVRAKQT